MADSGRENRQAIIQEYLHGHPNASLRELGELLGISRQRVHVLLRGMDLKNAGIKNRRKLTDHQLDILKHVAKGNTDRQIAEVMGCRAQTIGNQLRVIYAKLDIHKRKDAVRLAREQGILPRSVVSPE